MELQKRQFIRHPIEIPIQIASASNHGFCQTKNLSEGGVCIEYDHEFSEGEQVTIRIDICEPEFNVMAEVCWCQPQQDRFMIGISFLSEDDAYSARMVEQFCHIQRYKSDIEKKTGLSMTNQQAASEWISMFAASFPKI
jgi:Tfp pilus assembly protein PilZ